MFFQQTTSRQVARLAVIIAIVVFSGVARGSSDIVPRDECLSAESTDRWGSRPVLAAARAHAFGVLARLPVSFEANVGQAAPDVKFLARGRDYALNLTAHGASLSLGTTTRGAATPRGSDARDTSSALEGAKTPTVLQMKLVGANPLPELSGGRQLPGKSHYLAGDDPTQWHTDVAHYESVTYHDVYPDIDMVFYGTQGQLAFDFVVGPGADPRAIALAFDGAGDMQIDPNGDLVLTIAEGEVFRQRKPLLYQDVDGVRAPVIGSYRLDGRQVRFEVGSYDRGHTLVIDPTLVYFTYLSNRSPRWSETESRVTVDAAGDIYVAGQVSAASPTDIHVLKINAAGTAIVYSTYFRGRFEDSVNDIAVDDSGHLFLTGSTSSSDFPTTPNAFQPTLQPGIPHFVSRNAFVTKLNRLGNGLVYSTYLAGDGQDEASGIAIDRFGSAYVTGRTHAANEIPYPVTPRAFQPCVAGASDAFVTKLSRDGATLEYSTCLGGSGSDTGFGISVDAQRNAYVTGGTNSIDFPAARGLQDQPGGEADAFVVKLSANGRRLVYSTYLGGGSADVGFDIELDDQRNAYVVGRTSSTDFPVTAGALQLSLAGPNDDFVAKLDRKGDTLVYATYLGGSDGVDQFAFDTRWFHSRLALDAAGRVHVTGSTRDTDFPTTVDALRLVNSGWWDAYIATLSADGSSLVYSSYIGGDWFDYAGDVAVDVHGNVLVVGTTSSTDLPTTAGALQPELFDGFDRFLVKLWIGAQEDRTKKRGKR